MTEITESLVFSLLPPRTPEAHKGLYGKLLLVAGSSRYRGAAQLAAAGALRAGAGLVTLASTERVIAAAATALPECTYLPLGEAVTGTIAASSLPALLAAAESYTALAVGCGLAQSPDTAALVLGLAKQIRCPLLIDADGLNLLAGQLDLLKKREIPAVLTPHPGEMARLCGCTAAQVQGAREDAARSLARQTNCVVVLKGHGTLVAAPDGRCFQNTTGGPGLAKGGSGDVLTGLIGGLLAQGLAPVDAAASGGWLHGAAGDACASRRGAVSMLPHELLDDLCALLAARRV